MPQPSDHPIQPVTLTGQHVQLVPLSLDHCDELVAAVQDGELWRLWYTGAPEPEAMGAEIERRLALQAVGSMVPFTVLDGSAGRVVGMTTYMHIDQVNRRVEIGSTWYARRVQRTGLNPARPCVRSPRLHCRRVPHPLSQPPEPSSHRA